MGSVSRLLVVSLFSLSAVMAQSNGRTALAVVVAPECAIGVTAQSQTGPNTQTIAFSYKLRTSAIGGQGQITLRLSGAGTVDYQTTLAGPGTPASGTAAQNTGIVIARFGPQTHSSRAGATGTVQITAAGPSGPALSIGCQ